MVVIVNWNEKRVVSEDRFDEIIDARVDEKDTDARLDEFVDANYSASEVFHIVNANEDGCDRIHDDFVDMLVDEVNDELDAEGWVPAEIELSTDEKEELADATAESVTVDNE